MAEAAKVLYYVQDENKRIQFEVLCMGMALSARQLKASDLNEQVGVLAGMDGIKAPDMQTVEKAPAIFCMPEVVIFSGISNQMIDAFLLSYKNLGLAPIRLKAVTTPRNVGWTLYQLIRELAKEHGEFEAAAKRKQKNHGNEDDNVH